MLHNHGWEKQQTLLPKGSRPKRCQAGKETHQRILLWVKSTISYVYGQQKTITKIKLQKQKNCVHLIKLT